MEEHLSEGTAKRDSALTEVQALTLRGKSISLSKDAPLNDTAMAPLEEALDMSLLPLDSLESEASGAVGWTRGAETARLDPQQTSASVSSHQNVFPDEVSTAIPRDIGRPAPALQLPVHALARGLPMQNFPRNKIIYRSIQDGDLAHVRQLHAETFPFLYDEAFYEYLSSKKPVVVVATVRRADLVAFRMENQSSLSIPRGDGQSASPAVQGATEAAGCTDSGGEEELLVGMVSIFQRAKYVRDERITARVWASRREKALYEHQRDEMLRSCKSGAMAEEGDSSSLALPRPCNLDTALSAETGDLLSSSSFGGEGGTWGAGLWTEEERSLWQTQQIAQRERARRRRETALQSEAAFADDALRFKPLDYDPDAELGDLAYISTLAVAAPFRRIGVASQLLHSVVCFLRSPYNTAPTSTLFLHVADYNVAAIRFYTRHGFEIVQHVPDYYSIEDVIYGSFLCVLYLHEDCQSCARARTEAIRKELQRRDTAVDQKQPDFLEGLGNAIRMIRKSIGGMLPE